MMQIYPYGSVDKSKLFFRGVAESGVGDIVTDIIANVRQNGDSALLEYARRFDKAELSSLEVSQQEIDDAFAAADPALLDVIRKAAENIRTFHAHQVREGFRFTK